MLMDSIISAGPNAFWNTSGTKGRSGGMAGFGAVLKPVVPVQGRSDWSGCVESSLDFTPNGSTFCGITGPGRFPGFVKATVQVCGIVTLPYEERPRLVGVVPCWEVEWMVQGEREGAGADSGFEVENPGNDGPVYAPGNRGAKELD